MSWGYGETCQTALDAQRTAEEARSAVDSARWELEDRINNLAVEVYREDRNDREALSAQIQELWDAVNALREEIREAVRS